jgi:RNA polymerase sigma-70 factor (family 1)
VDIYEKRRRQSNIHYSNSDNLGMTVDMFKSVFDEYYRPLKNFLYYKLADKDLAEDMTQEVFIRAWDKRETILAETVKSYLYKIANNLAINHFNSGKIRYELKLQDHDRAVSESPEYVMEKDEFEELLNRALENLPETQRVVFLMNRIDDLTYREIAERLDLSLKAVEKRMQGALESLRTVTQSRF